MRFRMFRQREGGGSDTVRGAAGANLVCATIRWPMFFLKTICARRLLTVLADVLLVGFMCSTCPGQQSHPPVTIPTPVISGLVYMQGEVNSSAPLSVVLDTGSWVTIISPSVAQAVGLTSTKTTEAGGLGKGSSQTLHLLDDCELKLGNQQGEILLQHQQGAILPIDHLSAQVGKRVDVIFGSNLFLHYTVTVDYEHERTTFSLPGSGPPPLGNSIPIQILRQCSLCRGNHRGRRREKDHGALLFRQRDGKRCDDSE